MTFNITGKKYIFWGLLMVMGTVCFAQTYFLYGYENGQRKIFLGTFRVTGNKIFEDKHEPNSILNENGAYGSEYSSTSIWNKNGLWGDEDSSISAANPFSRNPPVILDKQGVVVGYLTANKHISNTRFGKSVSKYLGLQPEIKKVSAVKRADTGAIDHKTISISSNKRWVHPLPD